MRHLDDATFVAGQITFDDLNRAAEANVKVVVNHRTAGEDPDQITSEQMAEMCANVGMRYVELPVSGLPDQAAIVGTLAALESLEAGERALLFCRSGMRSSAAWAMAERLRGADADRLRKQALAAGYDLSRVPL